MKILEGKCVAENIKKEFNNRIQKLKNQGINPHITVMGIYGDGASDVYVKKIEKNCNNYGIKFTLKMANTEDEFRKNFELIKNDKTITGIMFQQPLPKKLSCLINDIPPEKDVEGVSIYNMGKLFCGEKDVIIPCTSKAVMEVIDFYDIDLSGKKVVIVGRSNIVGKPLIPQILDKNGTVTICHSKTENIDKEIGLADVVIMAIGKPKFLKKEHIKKDAILLDVGINFADGKIVGDIDFEDIKDKALMCTPVPGRNRCYHKCFTY